MSRKRVLHGSFRHALLCVAALGASCTVGKPSGSSSTNWLTCTSPEDCSAHPEAICSEDGFCVDEEGERIVAEAPADSTRVLLTALLTEGADGGAAIQAQWDNGTEQPIFLRGCSTIDGLYLRDGAWERYGAFVVCATEGPAVEVLPGERYQDLVGTAAPPDRGSNVWRLEGPYGVGCARDEILSQAACNQVVDVISENEVSW